MEKAPSSRSARWGAAEHRQRLERLLHRLDANAALGVETHSALARPAVPAPSRYLPGVAAKALDDAAHLRHQESYRGN